ncbi:uncharacterized protein LOC135828497 [Sycon ciliatum]|uniref:uncharacterized protein LOC135828497 n=1 Tax=Sycon ciliatum TaxID=27933 RepID=UPI0031F67070
MRDTQLVDMTDGVRWFDLRAREGLVDDRSSVPLGPEQRRVLAFGLGYVPWGPYDRASDFIGAGVFMADFFNVAEGSMAALPFSRVGRRRCVVLYCPSTLVAAGPPSFSDSGL